MNLWRGHGWNAAFWSPSLRRTPHSWRKVPKRAMAVIRRLIAVFSMSKDCKVGDEEGTEIEGRDTQSCIIKGNVGRGKLSSQRSRSHPLTRNLSKDLFCWKSFLAQVGLKAGPDINILLLSFFFF